MDFYKHIMTWKRLQKCGHRQFQVNFIFSKIIYHFIKVFPALLEVCELNNYFFTLISLATATCAFIRNGKLYTGHVGDSSIILANFAEAAAGCTQFRYYLLNTFLFLNS